MAVLRSYQNIKVNFNDNVIIEYGSTDKRNPEVIYINYKTYLTSLKNNNDYKLIIDDILYEIKRSIRTLIKSTRFDKKYYIFDYDLLQDIQPAFKNKILTFDLYLKQPKNNILQLRKLQDEIQSISENLINSLLSSLQSNNIELSNAKKN